MVRDKNPCHKPRNGIVDSLPHACYLSWVNLEDLAESIVKDRPLIPAIPSATDNGIFDRLHNLSVSDTEIMVVLEELLLNAQEHGQRKAIAVHIEKHLGWLIAAVRDQGPGIHATLPLNPRLSDTLGKSAAALTRLATEEGITGTGTHGRGIGLHLLSEVIRSRNGESLVLSDGGLFVQVGDLYLERKARFPILGTLVAFKVEIH